jgi:hypothetical protein
MAEKCTECLRLKREHHEALREHTKIIHLRHQAHSRRDFAVLDSTESVLRHSKRARDWAREALITHEATHRKVLTPEVLVTSSQRAELEARLRQALQNAKAEYESEKTDFALAVSHLEDLGLEHVNGRASIHQAVLNHSRAFAKYRRAREDFNRFMLDGSSPESATQD